ncbi:BON domain-containing protein [Variovorax sp. OV329]|uniref:BON domain-containing protein n=1 Tax=Variovorax sp. OV329 TaxID=1882825 RepID=UPI0008DEB712|nr:BON domain-containing protein [Variovorax sp. OV329]SFM40210.1 BON domain-containing protein [Variovorax sp. OV329]
MTPRARPGLLALCVALAGGASAAQERANFFNDPFEQVTSGIASCPVPDGPLITKQEMLSQTHGRAERGTSCYQSGRCRLPNAYLYDPDIVARSKKAVLAEGRYGDTSVWVMGQRRWVWLQGCVRTKAQSDALERMIRSLDDVENVMNELKIVPP